MKIRRGQRLDPGVVGRQLLTAARLAALGALLGALGLSAGAQEARDYTFAWAPSQAQTTVLSVKPSDPGPQEPIVSLKLALPGGQVPSDVKVVDESWSPSQWSSKGLGDHPVVSLGFCSTWHGISYQEIMVYPLKPSGSGDSALYLNRLRFQVDFPRPVASPALPEILRPERWLFLNPWDVEDSQAQESRAEPEAVPESTLPPASGAAFRISVSQDGIYRLDYSYLTGHGLPATGTAPNNLHLWCRGVEVPILVEGPLGSNLVSTNAVVFYGQKFFKNRDIWNGGDFTDTNVYWLYADSTPGTRMTSVIATPLGYPLVSSFQTTVHSEQNTFFMCIPHLRPNRDLWYWGFVTAANGPGSYSVSLPNPTGTGASLTAVLGGMNDLTHTVQVALNGAAPVTGGNPATWTGASLTTQSWSFSAAPSSVSNAITMTLSGGPADAVAPDFWEVTYTRTFDADSGALLFTAPNVNQKYSCPGYGSTAPYILDVSRSDSLTGLLLPKRLTNATQFPTGTGPWSFQMDHASDVSTRTVALSNAPLPPDDMVQDAYTNLSNASLGADLLIVTHPDFESTDPSSAWHSFLVSRGASMQVTVVEIQNVYDNFSYGIFDPTALQSFLATVGSAWSKKPKYVLLFGDGSYDYKSYMHASDPTFKNWVPTMMFEDTGDSAFLGRYASDAWFATLSSEYFPYASVGRIPVRSFTESEGVLQKILSYESSANKTGAWINSVLYVADRSASPPLPEFEPYNDFLASTHTGAPWSSQKIYFGQSPYNGTDTTQCAADIRAAFPNVCLLNYNGHANITAWGGHYGGYYFFSSPADVNLLSVTWHLPFVNNGTCYTADFAEVGNPSLLENLVKQPDRGAIASSGLTTIGYPGQEEAYTTPFWDQAFLPGGPKVRVTGDLVEAGRFDLPSSDARAVMSLVLLGDPSMALPLPAPPPPTGLNATGQNMAVYLSWSAPATTPSAYNLYRSSDGGGTWPSSPTATVAYPASSYTDTGLTNNVTYAYYLTSLTSLSPPGFEGPPSNTASATPSNPNPPAVPTGLAVTDTGTGTSLAVSWNANGEPDLSGYTLYWGTASGTYTSSQSFSKTTTSTVVSGLTTGTAYYFALKASNTSGKTSGYSAEAWGRPSALELAIRPPAMITDLKVTRSGGDLLLTWTAPTLDVGGSPVTVSQFLIYRVAGAYNWDPNVVSHLPPNAAIAVPATVGRTAYAYTDTGAFSLPDPLTYLIVALNAQGDASPVSNPPPSAVLDLKVTAAGGQTLLSFTPVTTDIQGRPDPLITRYFVYGFYPLTASSDHVRPASPVFSTTLNVPLSPCSGSAYVCYPGTQIPLDFTVVAVDNRGNTSLY